jgi:TonB family protein
MKYKSVILVMLTGQVSFEFEVAVEGETKSIKINKSNHSAFSELTKNAISKWKFEPAMYEGKPVSVVCRKGASFSLQDE